MLQCIWNFHHFRSRSWKGLLPTPKRAIHTASPSQRIPPAVNPPPVTTPTMNPALAPHAPPSHAPPSTMAGYAPGSHAHTYTASFPGNAPVQNTVIVQQPAGQSIYVQQQVCTCTISETVLVITSLWTTWIFTNYCSACNLENWEWPGYEAKYLHDCTWQCGPCIFFVYLHTITMATTCTCTCNFSSAARATVALRSCQIPSGCFVLQCRIPCMAMFKVKCSRPCETWKQSVSVCSLWNWS